jgi:hypothetical protein
MNQGITAAIPWLTDFLQRQQSTMQVLACSQTVDGFIEFWLESPERQNWYWQIASDVWYSNRRETVACDWWCRVKKRS